MKLYFTKGRKSMKFEILKRSHLKRNILIGVGAVVIISAIILNFTRAKYRVTESIPLVNGTINYYLADLNAVAIYIQEGDDYSKSDTIPKSGYTFNEERSYCTVNGEEDESITVSYDTNTQSLSVSPLTTKGTKCYLYFDEQRTLLKDANLTNNEVNSGTPNFSQTATTDEDKQLLELTKDATRIIVINKIDQGIKVDLQGVKISAKDNQIGDLVAEIKTMFELGKIIDNNDYIISGKILPLMCFVKAVSEDEITNQRFLD